MEKFWLKNSEDADFYEKSQPLVKLWYPYVNKSQLLIKSDFDNGQLLN